MYLNLWVAYWEMLFELGDMTEAELRLNVNRQFFNSAVARAFWEEGGEIWSEIMASQPRAKRAQFVRVVDTEYRKALATGPPSFCLADDLRKAGPGERHAHFLARVAGSAILVTAGAALGGWLWERYSRS